MISNAAAVCPTCGAPVPRPASERGKDLLLVLFIIAVVVTSIWVVIDYTIGRAEAKRLFATVFHTSVVLNDETASVPKDEFRGILVSVPYSGQVTLEIAVLGGRSVDVHVINGPDLLQLAGAKPPFAARKLNDFPAFAATAAPATTRTHRLMAGTYVVVLEHSTRGAPASDVRVIVRLTQ